jgi:protein-arginine kinase activator protein McsA
MAILKQMNSMSDEDIEKIASSVFQKLLAKQEEWDKHYHYSSDRQALIDQVTALNIIKAQYVADEKYELAQEITDKIKAISDELAKNN